MEGAHQNFERRGRPPYQSCRCRGSRQRDSALGRTATLQSAVRLASLGLLPLRASPRGLPASGPRKLARLLAHGNSHAIWAQFGRGHRKSPKRILSDGGPLRAAQLQNVSPVGLAEAGTGPRQTRPRINTRLSRVKDRGNSSWDLVDSKPSQQQYGCEKL